MGKQRWAVILIVLAALTLLAACGASGPLPGGEEKSESRGLAPMQPAPTMAPALDSGYGGGSPDWASSVTAADGQKVIQTADLQIIVKDTARVLDFVQGLAARMGGYVVSSRSWKEGEQLRAQVTVRVPTAQMQSALQQIRAQAIEVDNETIGGQDVTQEYTDLESRLRNLNAAETELLELLRVAREKTGKAEDILAIYREVSQIREQIETLQGRKQYLDTMTSMATISVDIVPEPLEAPIVEAGWKPLTIVKDASRALVQTLQSIAGGLIWVVIYVLPALAVVAVPFVVVWLLVRRARRKAARSA